MPARSPLTAAARQRSRRPVRHVVCNWGQTPINFVMYSRHAGSVAAHRRYAATFASARPPCRLFARQFFSGGISALIENGVNVSSVNRNTKNKTPHSGALQRTERLKIKQLSTSNRR